MRNKLRYMYMFFTKQEKQKQVKLTFCQKTQHAIFDLKTLTIITRIYLVVYADDI